MAACSHMQLISYHNQPLSLPPIIKILVTSTYVCPGFLHDFVPNLHRLIFSVRCFIFIPVAISRFYKGTSKPFLWNSKQGCKMYFCHQILFNTYKYLSLFVYDFLMLYWFVFSFQHLKAWSLSLNCRAESCWWASGFWIGPWWFRTLGFWLHHCIKVRANNLFIIIIFIERRRGRCTFLVNLPYILPSINIFSCFRYVMSPPIRASGHGKALQDALSNGVLQVSLLSL